MLLHPIQLRSLCRGIALVCAMAAPVTAQELHESAGTASGLGVPAPAGLGGEGDGWWSGVQREIAAMEYRVTWREGEGGGVYQAPNRANNLRVLFEPSGVRIEPREACEGQPDWTWGIALESLARGEVAIAMVDVAPAPNGGRVEYARDGVVEWYANDTRGVEQGFTIPSRLPGGDAPLRVEMRISGGLAGSLVGRGVEFRRADGQRVLVYDHLRVTDDAGRELASRLDVRGDLVSIIVEDAGAAYPITIDPIASSPAWVAQDVGEFGSEVATAGDVNGDGYDDALVVAARYDGGQPSEGKAFLYLGGPAGPASDPAWTFETNQANAGLAAVASAGDVNGDGYSDIAVGASGYGAGGRVWVFHGRAGGPSTSPTWVAEHQQSGARFGTDVASAGDVNGDGYSDLLISAPWLDSGGHADVGGVYLFQGGPSGLHDVDPEWFSTDLSNSNFGWSISTAGDVNGDGYADVIIGSPDAQSGPFMVYGAAHVFLGSASGLDANPVWVAHSDQDHSAFGECVSTAGDVNGDGYSDIIVGARWYDHGQQNEGRAFVYMGGPGGPAGTPAWTTESNQAEAQYGSGVAFAGDVNGDGFADVAVAAHYYNENGYDSNGKVWVFYGSADGLSLSSAWRESGNRDGGVFGEGLATAGDVNGDGYADLIIGQSGIGGNPDPGQAYVYLGGPDTLEAAPSWNVFSGQSQAQLGYCVASAGDVNGDGFADVIVGAPFYDSGQTDEGLVAVFYGGPQGPGQAADFYAEGNQTGAQLGTSVASAGDVNGDGYDDILAGAPYFDNGQSDEGRVYSFYGSATGISGPAEWSAEPSSTNARFGTSVASAGDVNGDGYSDVIIGAPFYEGEGGAFIYHGGSFGLLSAAVVLGEGQPGARYGWCVASAGDVNGDGFSDVAVGAPRWDGGQTDEGRVFEYDGSVTGVHAGADWGKESNRDNVYFGQSVASAGDVNGDGFSDLIIGAPNDESGETNEGRAFLYEGSAGGLSTSADWNAQSNQVQALFGTSVASAGDVNGDGYSDVVVGAYGYDNGESDEGRVWVFQGGPDGLGASSAWRDDPDVPDAFFGFSVAGAGDVNGDGFDDLIVGAPRADAGAVNDGRVSLYYGGGGAGITLNPRQGRTDNSNTPIAHLGLSDDETSFRVRAIGRGPVGRTRVKMEWEVKPLGVPFDGTGLQRGALWQDSKRTGKELTALATLLERGEPQHWRVRLLYQPSASPLALRGKWMSPNGNGWGEADVRTAGTACAVDLNADGVVNTQDFLLFLNLWNDDDSRADWNGDGVINTQDFLSYLNAWVAGC